jgi:type VI secretion system protein
MIRGLLSRLSSTDPSRPADEIRSILGNLHTLLNTREGDSLTAPDFGILDLSDLIHNFPDATQYVQRSIRDTITKYEPRLKNVRVRAVDSDDPLKLAFEISARLAGETQRGVVRVRTEIGPSGRATVE